MTYTLTTSIPVRGWVTRTAAPSALCLLLLLVTAAACSQAQSRPDLYRCDGCEVAAERSTDELDWRVELPPTGEPGEALVLSGRVFQPDGETPAAGVILYLHQTNAEGVYKSVNSKGRGGRGDGLIEGWLATDESGRYEITTIRPAPYPNANIPAHVHVYVKEPERRPYYLDDFVFEDDPYVDERYRQRQELRGGSGIVRLRRDAQGTWRAERDIVLER